MGSQRGKRIRHISLDERTAKEPQSVRADILARSSDPNATDERLDSQVEACEAFVRRMGWTLLSVHTERKSGYLHVERPALAEVEERIRQRAIDVVVCLNFERLARDSTARGAALAFARKYGVEYRFAELKPDGKIPNTDEAMMLSTIMEAYGAINRKKIVDNTERGRLHRASLGLPIGGSAGSPYGFRKAQPGDKYSYWAEEPSEAAILREMFERVATDENAGGRSLAVDLNSRGILTRGGKTWTGNSVLQKLRNPLYCGRGRLQHHRVVWEQQTYEATGETYVVRKLIARAPDEEGAYLPIKADALPVLIEPELFDRAQQMLDTHQRFHGKGARASSSYPVDATLLDGGFVRCAHCGNALVRRWRKDSPGVREHPVPYYWCATKRHEPANPCKIHIIPARAVDELVLKLLAFALTDPEQVAALADANAQRRAKAVAAVEITTAKLTGYRERLAQLASDRQRQVKKLALSDPNNEDDAEDIARYRERLARIDAEQAEIEAAMALLTPAQARASERAAFLRNLELGRQRFTEHADIPGLHYPYREMSVAQAASLIGMPEDHVQAQFGAQPAEDGTNIIPSINVVYWLLRRTPRDQVRKVLRDVGAIVEISRPRPPAERAEYGLTPIAERVALCVGSLRMRWPSEGLVREYLARSSSEVNGTSIFHSSPASVR
jgi:DNA invertase Pin-like site-specific DNA recombinase